MCSCMESSCTRHVKWCNYWVQETTCDNSTVLICAANMPDRLTDGPTEKYNTKEPGVFPCNNIHDYIVIVDHIYCTPLKHNNVFRLNCKYVFLNIITIKGEEGGHFHIPDHVEGDTLYILSTL